MTPLPVPPADSVSLRQVLENNYEREQADESNTRISSKEIEMIKTSLLTKSRALSDLVNYVEAVKFSGFDSERQFWEMSSFDETKVTQILRKDSNNKF